MKRLRSLHLYLGVLFAPLLIFFSATGAIQLFWLHENAKDGSYSAPPALLALGTVHKNSHLPGTPKRAGTPLRWFSLAAALGLVATTVLGLVMAFRFTASRRLVFMSLFAGTVIPAGLLWIFR
ncbi:MAG: hypothetical protein WCQ89_08790 [Verrucomicrobiota bacterium]